MIMPRKIERVFRDRKLTPEEIARDELVRRQVEKEIPPARAERGNDDVRKREPR
jgi:hypothetical protein